MCCFQNTPLPTSFFLTIRIEPLMKYSDHLFLLAQWQKDPQWHGDDMEEHLFSRWMIPLAQDAGGSSGNTTDKSWTPERYGADLAERVLNIAQGRCSHIQHNPSLQYIQIDAPFAASCGTTYLKLIKMPLINVHRGTQLYTKTVHSSWENHGRTDPLDVSHSILNINIVVNVKRIVYSDTMLRMIS